MLALTSGLCAAADAAPAHAGSTPTSAPCDYYTMKLGAFTVVALCDGLFDLPAARLLIGHPDSNADASLERTQLPETIATPVNAYLIDTGTRRILVDAGAGELQGPELGRLPQRLHAAGYASEAIDTILLTHLHPDHVGGIARAGRAAFVNAVVYVDETEAAFWLDRRNAGKVDASVQAAFDGARAALEPYRASGRLRTFHAGDTFAPGIRALATAGHTPGHSAFRVDSEGRSLLLIGDLLHVAGVQFADPAVTIRYDSAPARARAAREQVFAAAADERLLIAAAHVAFPGLGRLERANGGYAWLPVETTP